MATDCSRPDKVGVGVLSSNGNKQGSDTSDIRDTDKPMCFLFFIPDWWPGSGLSPSITVHDGADVVAVANASLDDG